MGWSSYLEDITDRSTIGGTKRLRGSIKTSRKKKNQKPIKTISCPYCAKKVADPADLAKLDHHVSASHPEIWQKYSEHKDVKKRLDESKERKERREQRKERKKLRKTEGIPCPYCTKYYTKNVANLDHHVSISHPEVWQEYEKLEGVRERLDKANLTQCSKCGVLVKKMDEHLLKMHGVE